VPELVERNIPATFFVTAGMMGEFAGWWPEGFRERNEKIAPLERFLQLPSNLIGIGAHTLTHPKLTLSSEADAKREIFESRSELQKLLHRNITTFSFPFGAFNEELTELCRKAGYSRVFTTQPMSAFRSPDEFATGRIIAEPTDWRLEFSLKLRGAYCWVPRAISLKRRFLSSALIKKIRARQVSTIRQSVA
jgi:peptidoglycan/xylan/chitin deacetylase (PgdA/CDA1 family)